MQNIDDAIVQLKGLISFFEDYRKNGFTLAMTAATSVALEMDIEPIFPKKWKIQRKKQFDENTNDVVDTESSEDSFRANYFIIVVDVVIAALERDKLVKSSLLLSWSPTYITA